MIWRMKGQGCFVRLFYGWNMKPGDFHISKIGSQFDFEQLLLYPESQPWTSEHPVFFAETMQPSEPTP